MAVLYKSRIASVVAHIIIGFLFWPFAVPFGAVMGLLYSFYPMSLINAFLRFGGYIALPGFVVGNVKVNGIHISYIDRNPSSKKQNSTDSCPSVVFIHGLTSQKLSWAPVVRSLPKTWRIVAIDLPGHGKSGFNMEHNYNVVNMGELLHEVFVSLNLKNIHIVGESIGAIYAGQYAYAHPESLSSATLLCPPGGHRLQGGQITPAMEMLENFGKGIIKKNPLFPETVAEFKSMLKLVLHDPSQYIFHDKMLEAVVHVQAKHYPNVSKVLSDVVNGGETEEIIIARLANNKIPGMIICGREDQVCHVSGAKIVKNLSPSTKVYIFNNCGHCISMEKPAKTAALLAQFITNHTK